MNDTELIRRETLNPTDNEIIQRVLEGDSPAFRTLVERHRDFAFKLAWQVLHSEEDARDAAQEAFIQVWHHLHRFNQKSRFTTWFYRIVVNKAMDHARRRKRRAETSFPANPDFRSPDDPERVWLNQEAAIQIRSAVDRLPAKQRLAFILREMQELNVRETSEVMKCSAQAVKSHLCAARKKLRKILMEIEGAS